MQPSALAAAAAQARSMETSLPLAPPDEAIHGTVVHRSRNALHLVEHPIEQLHNCCNKTTFPGDTDMKTGIRGLVPPTTTVPLDLHATIATNRSEASLAHTTLDAKGALDTCLQGACAMRSGIYHGERADAIAMTMAGSLGTSEMC